MPIKRILKNSIIPKPALTPNRALRLVTSKTGKGIYASSDTLFKGAIFGRDSIEVAEDLLRIKPQLVKRIILTLASLQGEEFNPANEEEPGKIIHEYRTTIVDGKAINDMSKHIFHELAAKWGGDDKSLVYFGSIDSTPSYIRLLGIYIDTYGDSILDEDIKLRSGLVVSVKDTLDNGLVWLIGQLEKGKSGLLEYHRLNPHGIENQVWKDSKEFYVHENGHFANHDKPIASIEVQGIVYDALLVAAKHLPDKRYELLNKARELRDRTISLLWQPNRKYFALGLDYDSHDKMRIIKTSTANPAALLDSNFFNELSNESKILYITSIVKTIMSQDFLTDVGIRSRAIKEAQLIPFWDYHGSYVSWPKETYDIAKGLRRQGFPILAKELENRLINLIRLGWHYPEFVYVDQWGRVLAGSPSPHDHGEIVLIDSTNSPETIQAWTVSAALAIGYNHLQPRTLAQTWQIKLEQQIITSIPHVKMLKSRKELRARYPTYHYRLVN